MGPWTLSVGPIIPIGCRRLPRGVSAPMCPVSAINNEEVRLRWVWRAESGGFKVEYAAVVLLVTVVVTAVLSFGLPTEVKSLYDTGV
ncbi:hypothetical protein GCM10009799_33040 [Nocardiopsis rhodophaea]|uniref:Flp family type IVb pilin n=1 Tax=Nocardiopsis rhodophaea TaxID=280238 RepID=A0ABP5ETE1_9ACTN